MFKAAEAVPALDWDFHPWVKAKGTSPEPTNREITEFIREYNLILESVRRTQLARIDVLNREDGKERTKEELQAEVQRWADMTWEEGLVALESELEKENQGDSGEKLSRRLAEVVARTVHDCPNVDQIMDLPGRIRSAYFGWFVGQMRPESLTAATS